MQRRSIIVCALALIAGTAHGKAHPAFSIVGEWVRVEEKPVAVTRYRADEKWSMHIVGLHGFTSDMSGTYTLNGNVLKRKILKTAFSKKRPYERRAPQQSQYQLRWLSRDRITLTTMDGPKNWKRFSGTWTRLKARSAN